MKKVNFKTMAVFVIMAAVVSCLLLNTADSAEPLVIASSHGSPFSNREGTGMIDLIVSQAFSKTGVKIQIVRTDGKTALEKANQGSYDGDIMRVGDGIITWKYPNLIQVPETFYTFEFVGFGKNVNVPMTGWNGLKPYRVGIGIGWIILDDNVNAENTKSLVRVINPSDLFNTLMKGETDIVIYERLMGYDIIKGGGLSDIHVLEPPFSSKPMFLYLNKKHKDLVPKLAAAISDMKKDGTIQKIIAETVGKYKK